MDNQDDCRRYRETIRTSVQLMTSLVSEYNAIGRAMSDNLMDNVLSYYNLVKNLNIPELAR